MDTRGYFLQGDQGHQWMISNLKRAYILDLKILMFLNLVIKLI